MIKYDEYFMRQALYEAEKALGDDEVPVGAVLVKENKILHRAYNQTLLKRDPTAHAEVIAIRAACHTFNNHRLPDCDLYVTLEPCAMCAGAIVLARISQLIYGAADPKAGACGSLRNIVKDYRLNHQVELIPDILADESAGMLKAFFRNIRKRDSD